LLPQQLKKLEDLPLLKGFFGLYWVFGLSTLWCDPESDRHCAQLLLPSSSMQERVQLLIRLRTSSIAVRSSLWHRLEKGVSSVKSMQTKMV
jgi:hypothetical protein